MKLVEVANKVYRVVRKRDSQTLFSSDSRDMCIEFIKWYDSVSPKYVDLRLIDPSGKEDDWHKD